MVGRVHAGKIPVCSSGRKTRRKCAMQNKLTKRIVGGVASVIGVAMSSLGGAAAADLSPQDRCAIAKLEATWQEAKCLTDAQIAGIRQGLTDKQVDRLKAACRHRVRASFENAEDLPGKCKTLNDDVAVDYALRLATDIPRACGESGPPCDARDPATLSTATLRNRTPFRVTGVVVFTRFIGFCHQDHALFRYSPDDVIPPGQTGRVDAEECHITRIRVHMSKPGGAIQCRDYTSSGTWYRTFQVVPLGNADDPDGCVVNRP